MRYYDSVLETDVTLGKLSCAREVCVHDSYIPGFPHVAFHAASPHLLDTLALIILLLTNLSSAQLPTDEVLQMGLISKGALLSTSRIWGVFALILGANDVH